MRFSAHAQWFHRAFTAAAMLLACAAAALGQDTRGMIFGTVIDPSSSAVADAKVVVTNAETNVAQSYRTNNTGYYEASLLITGKYRVTVEAAGFKKAARGLIDLPTGARLQVNFKLELGDVAESVTVTAEPPLLDTTALSSGAVLDNRSVLDLPNPAFAVPAMAMLTPGVNSAFSMADETFKLHSQGAPSGYSTAGGVGGNEWTIDGTPNNGNSRKIAYNPVPELVQELKVETSAFDASIGHSTGVQLSMSTKSGTNSLHGALREAHRQNRWQGMRFFEKQAYYQKIAQAEAAGDQPLADKLRATPGLASGRVNSYAAAVGGPVILPRIYSGKDKLFFFFGFAGFRNDSSEFQQATLPTMANRQGDFSQLLKVNSGLYQLYDPLTVRADPARPGHYVRDPIPGNILSPSRIVNPTYKFYQNTLPVPNTEPTDPRLEPSRNFSVSAPNYESYKSYANRADYHPSGSMRFFGRWSWNDWTCTNSNWHYFGGYQDLGAQCQNRTNLGVSADWVYTLSPSTILDVAVAGNDFRNTSLPTGFNGQYNVYKPSQVGLPSYLDAKAGDDAVLALMSWSGYSNVSLTAPSVQHYRTLSGKADFSHIRGVHSIRAGVDVRNQFFTSVKPGNTSGSYSFTNTWTQRTDDGNTPAGSFGHSWAAFMMGLPASVTIPANDSAAMANPYYGWYVQDNWRVTRKLSLALGLRMEYELGPTERYNRMIGYMDLSASLPISEAAQAAYAGKPVSELPASQFKVAGGSLYPGAGNVPARLWESQLMWLPRAAAAYQPGPNTVLRAGYGIFYDTLNVLNEGSSVDQSFYSRTTSSTVSNDFGVNWLLGNPAAGVSPMSDPFPVRADGTRYDSPLRDSLGLMAKVGRGWTYSPFERRHARQQRWRAGIQRQLGSSTVLDVAYAGSYSDNVAVSKTLSVLAGEYWATGLVRNAALASNLSANVANPFYIGNFAGLQATNPLLYNDMRTNSFFGASTIAKNKLLRPYPHMNGLSEYLPLGEVKTHSLEVSLQRRFSKGLSLNLGYSRLSNQVADFFYNEYDAGPSWRESNVGRPQRLTGSGIYELPFGSRRAFATSGLLRHLFGGFQVSLLYEYQPGQLVNWGNLFYYGDLDQINTGTRTLSRWFNTDNFERTASKGPASYHQRVFPTRLDGVRWDSLNNWSGAVQREFRIKERAAMQFRVDLMNLQNRSQFTGPNVDPYSTDFGKITAEPDLAGGEGGASKRWVQIMLRITF